MDESKWRPIVGAVGLASAVLGGLVFLFAPYYLVRLVCVFFIALGVGHAGYAWFTNVRQIHVRSVDYIYVGLGAIAVFLGLLKEQERVDALRIMMNAEAALEQIPRSVDELQVFAKRAQNLSCDNVISYGLNAGTEKMLHEPFCSWIPSIVIFLQGAHTSGEFDNFIANGLQTLAARHWDNPATCAPLAPGATSPGPGRRDSGTQGEMSPTDRAQLELTCTDEFRARTIITGAQLVRENETIRPNPADEKRPGPIPQVIRYVIWPFILAISIALRLTKVTADVTGWAR